MIVKSVELRCVDWKDCSNTMLLWLWPMIGDGVGMRQCDGGSSRKAMMDFCDCPCVSCLLRAIPWLRPLFLLLVVSFLCLPSLSLCVCSLRRVCVYQLTQTCLVPIHVQPLHSTFYCNIQEVGKLVAVIGDEVSVVCQWIIVVTMVVAAAEFASFSPLVSPWFVA